MRTHHPTQSPHPDRTVRSGAGVSLGGVHPAATTQPVAIADLERRFGWAPGSWQDKLLRAADQAGDKNGNVSRAELDAYLQATPDLQFLTSANLQQMTRDVGAQQRTSALGGWEGKLAQAADKNHDGVVTQAEFRALAEAAKAGSDPSHLWLPDQKAAALESAVASATNEADGLNGNGLKGDSLQKGFMHVTEDEARHDPAIVSYVVTAADLAESTHPTRRDNFHTDRDDAGSSTPADYDKSGYDQGHQRAAEDSVNDEAMDESFLMTNMAPQTPELNRMSWRVIETGVRQLVQATGAKATLNTGSLFIDANGKPLPPDQVKRIGKDQVAVPSHSFKTVLLEYPDGRKQAFAFVMPNRSDLPVKGDASMRKLIRDSMMPVSKLENLIAAQQGTPPGSVQLYPELSGRDAKLKQAPPPAAMKIPDWKSYPFANFIWPQPGSVTGTPPKMRGTGGDGGPTLDLGTLAHPR